MIIDLISFGFKDNNLPAANHIIDVRLLNNPFYIDELRSLNGLDKEVIEFFEKDKGVKIFLEILTKWIEYLLEANNNANKEKIIIAIGCTGGQHRSPYIVEYIAKTLIKKKSISELAIYHTTLKKYNVFVPS